MKNTKRFFSALLALTIFGQVNFAAADDLNKVVEKKLAAVNARYDEIQRKRKELADLQRELRAVEAEFRKHGERTLILTAVTAITAIATYKFYKKAMRMGGGDISELGVAVFGIGTLSAGVGAGTYASYALSSREQARKLEADAESLQAELALYAKELEEDAMLLKRLQGSSAEKP